ncbi:uncharacterized protein LOC121780671 isoform X1 [Salvia splendens]|uniref:uncharacterized protein LOC121780671 isoform X1 n=1 Tax=Salvia splendens TaxID=180675 RepID=UPI001C26931B|nr:uncharacterized protein LOC121780671 isoform X1 [Salvia splendens]XP_042034225.1 uncharacterized protein LOC121780671 isoform X1 [Salvia splendens]XP_042034226.1 uncharacterized protein LOC121780671 isoform X1 [Salvia splendens]
MTPTQSKGGVADSTDARRRRGDEEPKAVSPNSLAGKGGGAPGATKKSDVIPNFSSRNTVATQNNGKSSAKTWNGGEAKGKEQAKATWRSSSKLVLGGKGKGKEKVDDDYKAPAASDVGGESKGKEKVADLGQATESTENKRKRTLNGVDSPRSLVKEKLARKIIIKAVNWGQDSTRNGPTEQAPRGQPSVVPAVPNPTDEVEVVNRMKLRRSPKFLVEMMELLNENQLQAVRDMGFGHLIHFNITSIPSQLAYWLLYNFDPITCSVKVRGQRVHLTEEDVHMTMGFPRGEIMIVRSTRQDNQMMLDEIASVGYRNRYNMLPKFLQTQMLKDEDGGLWFRRLFLILTETHLIEPSADGYCKTKLLGVLADVTHVRNYNWCAYVLDVLVMAQRNWMDNPDTPFTGPIVFLMSYYVDRFIIETRKVRRAFPSIKGWNFKLLRLREKHELELGGFGYGVYEAKYDPSRDNEVGLTVAKKKKKRAIVVERGESAKPKGVTEKGGTSNTKADDAVDHATDAMMALMEAASNAAKAISKLLRKMREAPDDVKGTGCFKIASTAALKMIGFKESELINEHADPIASMTPTMEDEDIQNPAWIEAVEQMMKVVDERVALCKDDDIPTFDLGLRFASQDDANQTINSIVEEQVPGMEHTLHTGGVIISSAVQDVLPNEEKDDSEEDNTQLALNVVHNLIDDFDFATPYVSPPGKREFTTSGLRDSKKSVGPSSHNEAIAIQHKQELLVNGRMEMRSKAEKKISHALRSPYNQRAIKLGNTLTPTERETYYWILKCHDVYDDVLVYDDDVVVVTKLEFYSLLPHTYVSSGVISAWCSYLNNMEEYRGPSSPKRLFFTLYPCASTIVSRTNPWDEGVATQLATFAANLDHEVKLIPNFKWADIDMVFFPICAHEHYYAVCFYYASKRVIVIDNSSSGDSDNITVNYGVIPETLRTFFWKYLGGVGCVQQSKAVENSAIERLKLKWSTKTNKDDSGVYLMRHLETYMGQKGCEWTCGLSKKSKGVLQILRAKYCTALMLAEINHEHFKNKAKVIPYYANALQTEKIDVEKLIANYAKEGTNLFN